MAHPAQQKFCEEVKEMFPHYFDKCIVLDVGSLDINGNNRDLFGDCDYIGVDIFPGKNVDVVSRTHQLTYPERYFNTIISTECFEHDMYYVLSLLKIVSMLKPNGLFLFTCAGPGRGEHGTADKRPMDSPFTSVLGGWMDYYKNLDEKDIRLVINIDHCFSEHEFRQEGNDLFFWGVKKGI